MFAMLGANAPRFETRRALLVMNMQNDSFQSGDFLSCQDNEFAERLKAMLPSYRSLGDIFWVRTEIGGAPASASRQERGPSIESQGRLGLDAYFSSSRAKAKKKKGAGGQGIRTGDADLYEYENDDPQDTIDDFVSRPRKGQPPQLYQSGTHGAALRDDFLPLVDERTDMTILKNHWSAFDATPLLMSLRMRVVTHIYLSGAFSNISIYATAADAVRHGFEVTVVEDCMGYRSESKHVEAMRKMADFLGVSGVDSEEIITEASGQAPPPDADASIFTGPGLEGIRTPKVSAITDMNMDIDTVAEVAQVSDVGAKLNARLDFSEQQDFSSPSAGDPLPETQDLDVPLKTVLGPGDLIGEGDSDILYHALSDSSTAETFKLVRDEVSWHAMHHRSGEVPRRVAVQGDIAPDGSMPVYRHPADESPPLLPFSKTVRRIRDEVQMLLKQPFNHALVQLYRNGQDNISEHSDKTLDIVRGSSIVNVSLGAQRTMTLRTKKSSRPKREDGSAVARQTQKVPLPHNSVFVLGSQTNAKWLHGVRPDKRQEKERSEAEKAFGGERVSITFRNIGTYINANKSKIWGQGAVSKYQATAGKVMTANGNDMDAMIIAFGKENQQSDFSWDAEYGKGFDVLNLAPARSMLYLCGDEIANLRVKMCILNSGLDCHFTRTRPDTPERRPPGNRRTIFALSGDDAPLLREADPACSEVAGDLAILFYLNKLYPLSSAVEGTAEAAKTKTGLGGSSASGAGASGPAAATATLLGGTATPATESAGNPPTTTTTPTPTTTARELQRLASNVFARITQANELLFLWQELRGRPLTASTRVTHQVRRMSVERASDSGKNSIKIPPFSPPPPPPIHQQHQQQQQQQQQPHQQQNPQPFALPFPQPFLQPSPNQPTQDNSSTTTTNNPPPSLPPLIQSLQSLQSPPPPTLTPISPPPPPPPTFPTTTTTTTTSTTTTTTTKTATAPTTTTATATPAAGASQPSALESFEGELDVWEEYGSESEFIAGDLYAIVDCAFWPVLNEIVRRWEGWSERRYPHLADYWRKVGAMESTRGALVEGRG